MPTAEELGREVEALRERAAKLNGAVLLVGASLDLGTVLRQVVDSARSLTDARYGVVTTIDRAGRPRDFESSGFTAEERAEIEAWPEALRLFEHLRDLPGPVRAPDLAVYLRTLGHGAHPLPAGPFQGAPMLHRGEHVGSFFLGKAEPFTDRDEEVLLLFAAQAASAIANALLHEAERRSRADLEALIDASPVGVAVFDAASGRPLSANREARRIVAGLDMPGKSPDEVLQLVACRFPDGREVALAQVPLARQLGDADAQAEELVLSVPDGRSVSTLVNATPIRGEDGAMALVTMQDLAPLKELERQRAALLSLVSHELRAPLTSIKGAATTALASSTISDAEARQFFRIVDSQADHMHRLIGDLLDAGRIEAGMLAVEPAPARLGHLVERACSDFASGGGQQALRADLPAELPPVLVDSQRIVQVLNNLLSNAARHAPASSEIRIGAARDGSQVAVWVADEGRGFAAERLPLLFRAEANPAGGLGSGLGLAICRGLIEAHGGRIRAESDGEGRGARFTFTVPVAEQNALAAAGNSAGKTPANGQTTILVVDDDPQTLRLMRDILSAAGYRPVVTPDPAQVQPLLASERPALVLLDLVLPGTDGVRLMESIPELGDLPVMFVSGYGRDETIARALDSGAADYIVKPFSPIELAARVRAALRGVEEPEPFVLGDLTIDYAQRRVTVAGQPVRLTPVQFDLLRVLSMNAGRPLPYETLMRQAWGGGRNPSVQSVRTLVKKLRGRLGDDAANPKWILNERAIGYRMPMSPSKK